MLPSDEIGQVVGHGATYRIQTAISIDHGIDLVWRTATSSDSIGWWFAPGTVGPEGGEIRLNHPDGSFGMSGRVIVSKAPHVFEFSWDRPDAPERATVVRLDLIEDQPGRTSVVLTSLAFESFDVSCYVAATWRFMLERLARGVTQQRPQAEDERRVAELAGMFQRVSG